VGVRRRCLLLFFAAIFAAAGSRAAGAGDSSEIVDSSRRMTLEGRWDEAVAALNAAVARAKHDGDGKRETALRVELLRVVQDRSSYNRRDPGTVAEALEAAQSAARKAGDPKVDADLAQSVGQVRYSEAFSSGDWQTPRGLFLRALEGRKRAGDRRGESESLFYLGLTYEQAGEKAPARERYEASLAISEKIQDASLQSFAHRHLGGLLEEEGRLDAAYEHIARSVALRREARFFSLLPFALIQQADFLAQHRGQRAQAIALLDEAIDVAEDSRSTRALSAARLSLAKLLSETGDATGALSVAQCGLRAARDFGDREGIAEAEKQVADLERRTSS
jgi:tetratricopeptide (TPR) repeat protein